MKRERATTIEQEVSIRQRIDTVSKQLITVQNEQCLTLYTFYSEISRI